MPIRALMNRAKAKLRQLPPDAIDSSLEKHGFSSEPMQQIPQILAIFAPLLAGSIGEALTGMGSAYGH
ncbi:MAG: hypothetical protein PHG00_13665 [Methylococcales bacterium]|nr:hypothetical protein [Methylococcales bacterium]